MIQKIKNKLLMIGAALMFALPAAVPMVASAQNSPTVQENVCKGANDLQISSGNAGDAQCQDSGDSTTNSFNDLLRRIINVFSVIVGIIAVIMIIWGGLRYVTSGGDSSRVGNAKNTILYALIGLVIVALAQVIVKFILSNATGNAG